MSSIMSRLSPSLSSIARKQMASKLANNSTISSSCALNLPHKFFSSARTYSLPETTNHYIFPQSIADISKPQLGFINKMTKKNNFSTHEIKNFSDVARVFKEECLKGGINFGDRSDALLKQDAINENFDDMENIKARALGLCLKGFVYKEIWLDNLDDSSVDFSGSAECAFREAAELDSNLQGLYLEQKKEIDLKIKELKNKI